MIEVNTLELKEVPKEESKASEQSEDEGTPKLRTTEKKRMLDAVPLNLESTAFKPSTPTPNQILFPFSLLGRSKNLPPRIQKQLSNNKNSEQFFESKASDIDLEKIELELMEEEDQNIMKADLEEK